MLFIEPRHESLYLQNVRDVISKINNILNQGALLSMASTNYYSILCRGLDTHIIQTHRPRPHQSLKYANFTSFVCLDKLFEISFINSVV